MRNYIIAEYVQETKWARNSSSCRDVNTTFAHSVFKKWSSRRLTNPIFPNYVAQRLRAGNLWVTSTSRD